MNQHTPGPWHVHQTWRGWHGIEIRAGDTSLFDIRVNGHNEKHGEANARLIAAAPDLLAALENLVADFDVSVITTDPMLIEARAAIAKARGKEIPAC